MFESFAEACLWNGLDPDFCLREDLKCVTRWKPLSVTSRQYGLVLLDLQNVRDLDETLHRAIDLLFWGDCRLHQLMSTAKEADLREAIHMASAKRLSALQQVDRWFALEVADRQKLVNEARHLAISLRFGLNPTEANERDLARAAVMLARKTMFDYWQINPEQPIIPQITKIDLPTVSWFGQYCGRYGFKDGNRVFMDKETE